MSTKQVVKKPRLTDLVLEAEPISLGSDGAPPSRFRIAAFGKNSTTKGDFFLKPEDAKAMVERASKRGIKSHADYEHASVHAAAKGTEAPASAWYDLEVGEDGLYAANVEWTPPALTRLRNREYRYTSPWFGQREDGTVASFKNFALTNRPATDNLAPLIAAEDEQHPSSQGEDPQPEKPKMKTLFKHLMLSDDASEAEVLQAVQHVSKERDAFYTATGTKDMPSALAAFETNRVKAAEAEKLGAELAAIKGSAEKKERELLLNDAVETGAIPPNMKDLWAGETFSLDQLKAYVAKAPKMGKPAAGSKAPAEKDVGEIDLALNEDDKAIAKALNIAEDDFAKQKKFMHGRV